MMRWAANTLVHTVYVTEERVAVWLSCRMELELWLNSTLIDSQAGFR